MKTKKISRNLYTILIATVAFTVSFLVTANSVYAADFSTSFSPVADAVEQDANTDITISFDRAVYANAEGEVFTSTTLGNVVSLHTTNADGATIPFTVSIDTGNIEITIDPTNPLSDGAVYVAISDAYYDGDGLQGDAASAIFFVTTTEAPGSQALPAEDANTKQSSGEFIVSSTPANTEVVTDNTTSITLTFNQPAYRNSNQVPFTTNDLASFVVLRTEDVYGYGIPFEASMSADNTAITIDPVDVLQDGAVYVAISEDYYSADKTRGVSFKTTFSVDTGTPPPVIDDIFSYLLTSSPFDLLNASNTTNKKGPSIQATEEFREKKIKEALSLLQQALELLAIVAAIDGTTLTAPTTPPADSGQAAPSEPQITPDLAILKIRSSDAVRGDGDIVLIEYSDYECPFCQRFHSTAQALVDNGEAAWIYRHLPLPFHATAKDGAVLGECVKAHRGTEAFWTYTDGVFAAGTLNLEVYKGLGRDAELSDTQMDECLAANSKQRKHVEQDIQDAGKMGVNGTPGSFLVNTKTEEVQFIPGALPLEQIQSMLKAIQMPTQNTDNADGNNPGQNGDGDTPLEEDLGDTPREVEEEEAENASEESSEDENIPEAEVIE